MLLLQISALLFTVLSIHGGTRLEFVAVVYRHGDRTPVDPYPTDPWGNESLWPVKFGQLTNLGKRQQYHLGKFFRSRYTKFISQQYDPDEIYVRSTDVDRTLMSAQANLAGMYPPNGSSVWNPELNWQPIPVHTLPEADDEVLAGKKYCKAYEREKSSYKESKEYKDRLSLYQDLMNYLTAYTGRKIRDLFDIESIFNILYIETLYNMTLPKWTHAVYPEKMLEPSQYSFTTSTATPLMARLRVGPLIKEIVTKMKERIAGKPLKMIMYSAHDDTIGSVLNALKLYDRHLPKYTATIFFELRYDLKESEYIVRILYHNTTDSTDIMPMGIPYCGINCPLDRFLKLYDNLVTVQWDSECNRKVPTAISMMFLLIVTVMTGSMLVRKMAELRYWYIDFRFFPFRILRGPGHPRVVREGYDPDERPMRRAPAPAARPVRPGPAPAARPGPVAAPAAR